MQNLLLWLMETSSVYLKYEKWTLITHVIV